MAGFRVSIPNSVRKTIQNIKEIAGNHSDEEIYAMLKDCSMDPNETAQKLLLQDTFHEVKRKRDRRKENNREPADSRWRPGVQGRGGRGGRGNYSSRHISHDAIGGRSISVGKENEDNKGLDRGTTSSLSPITQDSENKFTTPASSSFAGVANGPTKLEHPISAQGCATQVSGVSEGSSAAESNGIGITPPASIDVKRGSPSEIGGSCGQPVSTFDQFLPSMIPASVSGAYASDSDPVLLPSLDSRIPGVVGTIKREVGGLRVASETTTRTIVSPGATGSELPSRSVKGSSEVSNSYIQGKMPSKPHGVEVNQLLDTSQAVPSSSHTGSSSSRPSSNYSNRSQQPSGSQKAGPSKEWKPKATNVNPAQASGMLGTPDVVPITAETTDPPLPALSSMASEENTSKLQKKLDELQFSDTQHVIIPNHLQVPESERTRLSFGSFDASFGVGTSFVKGPDSNKSSSPLSESSQESEDNAEELSSSIQNASPTAEDSEYPDHPQSPIQMPENLSSKEADIFSSISAVREYDQPKPEAALAQEGPQYSVVHTTPTYSTFGIPQMLGGQFAPFESVEPQARDSSRPSSFVVQQPFDPSANYFTQIYRPTSDGDGRFSPFPTPGAATKYNGHIAVIPAQSGQSPPEGGNSLVLSTTGPTPLVTQAAGVMQSSVAVNQQAVPVFRQPGGLQLPPYHPNYMPYSQYFPQFYVPPPAIHHFLSNATFPQQPPTGSIYPPPAAAAAATAVKYPISQYKPGTNTGSSTHVGMPTGYGTYSTTLAGYSPSAVVTSGNLTGNEDLTASHYKENNAYITGQQTEGSAVWFSTPGRDISGLQASSFYNLSPQGQPMTFTPTQAGHGSFPGIYHPTQAVPAATVHPLLQQPQTMAGAVEMAGPPAGVYQQPQRGQINWPNNY